LNDYSKATYFLYKGLKDNNMEKNLLKKYISLFGDILKDYETQKQKVSGIAKAKIFNRDKKRGARGEKVKAQTNATPSAPASASAPASFSAPRKKIEEVF
jgi:hypothetical protein